MRETIHKKRKTRSDSLDKNTLPSHINRHCMKNRLPFRYRHFKDMVADDSIIRPFKIAPLARLFKISRPTAHKWVRIERE